MIVTPRLVVLDSATIAKVSHDFWSSEQRLRRKAQSFLSRFEDLSLYIALTLTNVMELLGHENDDVVDNRFRFLRNIRLVAWLRPYDPCNWFLGGYPDLLRRELHAVVHGSAKSWQEIVTAVRPHLWIVGEGSELFTNHHDLWSFIRSQSCRQRNNAVHIASIRRTDPGYMAYTKYGDILRSAKRPKEERDVFMRQFAGEMEKQIACHGDKRVDSPSRVTAEFLSAVTQDIKTIEQMGGDPILRILQCMDVPEDLVSPDMTVAEVGALGVHVKQLKILARKLLPPVDLTIREILPDALPSLVIERKLSSIQERAERVSGSDIGDGNIAPLVFYADSVEIDKRTYEYLQQLRRKEPELASLMGGKLIRSSDYSEILSQLEQ